MAISKSWLHRIWPSRLPRTPSLRSSWPKWADATIGVEPYIWSIDNIAISDGLVTINGWLPPFGGVAGNMQLRVNGVVHPVAPTYDAAVQNVLPRWPNAGLSSFRITRPAKELNIDIDGNSEIVIVAEPCLTARSPLVHEFARRFVYQPSIPAVVPPQEVRDHIGGNTEFFFRMTGRTLYRAFQDVLKTRFRRDFNNSNGVLDWGCGSARVGAHVLDQLGRNATIYRGFDIDKQALDWAAATYGSVFGVCDLMPPLPVDAGAFDLVFAYSVFTHLATPYQDAWLAELRRVTAPGSVLLFTVMSDFAMLYLQPHVDESWVVKWQTDGISDSAANDQLTGAGIGGEYYRNVWHTKPYIMEHWGEFFDVIAIVENFHYYQDLVICRRR